MSVIVKGMEMPVNCFRCPLDSGVWKPEQGPFILCRYTKGKVDYDDVPTDRRLPCCGLKELLEEHGRLIEADSLKETLDYYIREAGWDEKTNRVLGWVKDEFIDAEPTIVEAET